MACVRQTPLPITNGDGAVAQLRAAAIAGMPPPMYEGTEKGLVGAQGAPAEPQGVATV